MTQPNRRVPVICHPNPGPRLGRSYIPSPSLLPQQAVHPLSFFPHFSTCCNRNAELFTEHWTIIFRKKTVKQDVVAALSNRSVLSEIDRQACSSISGTQKRVAGDSLFQALHYNPLLSRSIPVIQQTLPRKALNLSRHKQGYSNRPLPTSRTSAGGASPPLPPLH